MRFIVLMILLSACSHTLKTGHQKPEMVVIKMVNAIDTKEWSIATKQFSDEVFVDYSSMTGKPGSKVMAKDLVGGWKKLLTKAETHHRLANFEVSSDGKTAEVFSHVYALHNARGVKPWDIYGRYHHQLEKTSQGWKITAMKLIVHGQKGNRNFLKQVQQ